MGYDYCIRIALKDIDPSDKIDRIIEQLSLELAHRDWFPKFGIIESGGYGTGPGDHFEDEIIRLTSQVPFLTFYVYFFYWDLTNLIVYEIKDTDVKKIYEHSFERELPKIPGGRADVRYTGYINVNRELGISANGETIYEEYL